MTTEKQVMPICLKHNVAHRKKHPYASCYYNEDLKDKPNKGMEKLVKACLTAKDLQPEPKFPLATPNDLLLSGEGSKAVANCIKAWSNLTTYWKERAEKAEQALSKLEKQVKEKNTYRVDLELISRMKDKVASLEETIKEKEHNIQILLHRCVGIKTQMYERIKKLKDEIARLHNERVEQNEAVSKEFGKLKARLNELEGR